MMTFELSYLVFYGGHLPKRKRAPELWESSVRREVTMTKFVVKFDAETEGNWCSQCTGIEYPTRAAALDAITADPTAKPDEYGNTCSPYVEEVDSPDRVANVYRQGEQWFAALFVDGEYDSCNELDAESEEEALVLAAKFADRVERVADIT